MSLAGAVARVFLGELAGSRSPVHTFTPLLGAQIDSDAGTEQDIDIDPAFEHGVLCDSGTVHADGTALAVADLAYRSPGRSMLHFVMWASPARARAAARRALFTDELVMWWTPSDAATTTSSATANCEKTATTASAPSRGTGVRSPDYPPRRYRPPGYGLDLYRKESSNTMTTDKTGAETTVSVQEGRYTVAVEGKTVGLADFADRDNQRAFYDTEIDPQFGGQARPRGSSGTHELRGYR